LEQSSFDVAYLTELDPMWHDDERTFIFNPDAALFGNLPARAACAAGCAAATADSL
jgi:conjugal transfer pilus assembly protein TraU